MEVFVTPEARKQIKKLPKIIQISVTEKIKKLRPSFVVDVKKLTRYKNAFRVRAENYRIVYRVLGGKIYIVLVGHRKEVYKLLDRILK